MTPERQAYERGAYARRTGRQPEHCDEPTLALRVWWVFGFQDAGKEGQTDD